MYDKHGTCAGGEYIKAHTPMHLKCSLNGSIFHLCSS